MVGYNEERAALEELDARVLAASVDDVDKARAVGEGLFFPVCHGVTREVADTIGAWWEERRGIIQPSEFILDAGGSVKTSTYSSGPVGRIAPRAAVQILRFYESRS